MGGKSWVPVLISNKIGFKTKAIVRDKGHYIIIKGTIQQEDITLENIYTLNTGASGANLDGHKGRDRQKCSHSQKF